MTNQVFNAYSRYYDLLYKDKDYLAEAEYIHALLNRYGFAKGQLLEFGSGTGRHGRILASFGHDIHGIERSAEMVGIADQTAGFTIQQGDICTIQMGQVYDAVLSLFHVVSYQVTNEAVKAVFMRASEHLKQGGIFLFDVWYSPAVYMQKPSVRVKRICDSNMEITRVAEPVILPNENRVDVNYNIFARDVASGRVDYLNESHPMRHFSLPEIDLFAQSVGLVRVGAEEFLTGNEPSEDTWGVCFVLKKV